MIKNNLLLNPTNSDLVILIVTHNSQKFIDDLLSTIYSQTALPDKVIIVDNNSVDNTKSIILRFQEQGYDIDLVALERNMGGAFSFARGLEKATALDYDLILTLDDDAFIKDKFFLQKLLEFKKKYHLDIACPLVVDVNNHQLASFFYKINNIKYFELKDIQKISYLMNDLKLFNGVLFSAHVIKEIGYPNPIFFIRGDEVDFRNRILQSGFKTGISTQIEIYHPSSIKEFYFINGRLFHHIDAKKKQFYSVRNKFYILRNKKDYFIIKLYKFIKEITHYTIFYLWHRKLDVCNYLNYVKAAFFGFFKIMYNQD